MSDLYLMEGLVVSLDPKLKTLERIWVVAEIAQAMKHKPVQLRSTHELAKTFFSKNFFS